MVVGCWIVLWCVAVFFGVWWFYVLVGLLVFWLFLFLV